MVPVTATLYQPMRKPDANAREQIVAEIAHLESELEARLRQVNESSARPAPASVVAAYRALLTAHYERLERIDER